MLEGIKGEVEGLRGDLSQIRTQQAPWEAQAAEVNSRVSVATAERDLLLKKQHDAQKRLQVRSHTLQPGSSAPELFTLCSYSLAHAMRSQSLSELLSASQLYRLEAWHAVEVSLWRMVIAAWGGLRHMGRMPLWPLHSLAQGIRLDIAIGC